MSVLTVGDFAALYTRFQAPISALDCGERCAPHNERGVPFCCDTRHALPTAYQAEWTYLEENTDLWQLWQGSDLGLAARLRAQVPDGQVLIACQGHERCQREFRSVTCRSFPFFPYLDSNQEFLGLSYYWEYEERCWVISNLGVVSQAYRAEFIGAYDYLFEQLPEERESFGAYAAEMRRHFLRKRRAIPLLHRNGDAYKISPKSERLRRVPVEDLPKFGPYELAARLPFPDEKK